MPLGRLEYHRECDVEMPPGGSARELAVQCAHGLPNSNWGRQLATGKPQGQKRGEGRGVCVWGGGQAVTAGPCVVETSHDQGGAGFNQGTSEPARGEVKAGHRQKRAGQSGARRRRMSKASGKLDRQGCDEGRQECAMLRAANEDGDQSWRISNPSISIQQKAISNVRCRSTATAVHTEGSSVRSAAAAKIVNAVARVMQRWIKMLLPTVRNRDSTTSTRSDQLYQLEGGTNNPWPASV